MSAPPKRRPTVQAGFTLIELLVVMTMLSLIMIAMVNAFRSMGQTEVRVDERLQRVDQIRVVQHFLQSTLGRMDATSMNTADNKTTHGMLFQVQPESISWIGMMPARPGIGGRHFFRLAIENLSDGKRGLVLRHQPWGPLNTFPDWQQTQAQVLASDFLTLQVQAQGLPHNLSNTSNGWPMGWQNGWPDTALEAPERIRLLMRDRHGLWPPMTIPLFPSVSSSPINSGFVAGGSR